jgi:hypothetical protein
MGKLLSEASGSSSCSLEGKQSCCRSLRSVICTFKLKARLLSAFMAAGMGSGKWEPRLKVIQSYAEQLIHEGRKALRDATVQSVLLLKFDPAHL